MHSAHAQMFDSTHVFGEQSVFHDPPHLRYTKQYPCIEVPWRAMRKYPRLETLWIRWESTRHVNMWSAVHDAVIVHFVQDVIYTARQVLLQVDFATALSLVGAQCILNTFRLAGIADSCPWGSVNTQAVNVTDLSQLRSSVEMLWDPDALVLLPRIQYSPMGFVLSDAVLPKPFLDWMHGYHESHGVHSHPGLGSCRYAVLTPEGQQLHAQFLNMSTTGCTQTRLIATDIHAPTMLSGVLHRVYGNAKLAL